MELIDLTGQKFGKLTVINRVLPNHFNGGVRWKCKCECSKKYIGYSSHLISGNVKSCGCSQYSIKDLMGQQFGDLTVVEFISNTGKGALWKCKCICGNYKNVLSSYLVKGHTKSCGCWLNRKGKDAPGWKGGFYYKDGYKYIVQSDHRNVRSNGYVIEHRLVMEEHLGRYLTPDETVHHKNGIRDDNRIENLELWTGNHPNGVRRTDLLEWCKKYISERE